MDKKSLITKVEMDIGQQNVQKLKKETSEYIKKYSSIIRSRNFWAAFAQEKDLTFLNALPRNEASCYLGIILYEELKKMDIISEIRRDDKLGKIYLLSTIKNY